MQFFTMLPTSLFYADLSYMEFKILASLYSFRNQKSDLCFPSLKTIASRCGINDATKISKITKSLENKGFVKKSKSKFGGTNSYEVLIPDSLIEIERDICAKYAQELGSKSTLVEKANVGLSDQANVGLSDQVNVGRNDNQTYNITKNITKNGNKTYSSSATPDPDDPALEIFRYWVQVMSKRSPKPTKGRLAKIRSRLKDGYTIDQIKTAIDGCKNSSYHMGKNDSGKRYDCLTLICRSAEKLEQFIGYTQAVSPDQLREQEAMDWVNDQDFYEGEVICRE